MAADGIWHARILEKSSHRDGAIYKENWGECFLMDLADRNEIMENHMYSKTLNKNKPIQHGVLKHFTICLRSTWTPHTRVGLRVVSGMFPLEFG
uniref:Uncharacterized protein n=1 Tax=Setaria viridis TaxID=4556 RepID=A0A4U6V519_SETVI|nr:hypothetical protein SEVIR_4G157300v2 [Setaria viridis]